MAEANDRAQDRLDNLEAIEPLLGSMRVLALSTMQMALKRMEALNKYLEHFNEILGQLRPLLKPETSKQKRKADPYAREPKMKPNLLLVFGSSRGIVGQYNRSLARSAADFVMSTEGENFEIHAYGKRVHSALGQLGLPFTAHEALNKGSQPDYGVASELLRSWRQMVEDGSLKEVQVLSYVKKPKGNDYEAKLSRLIPQEAASLEEEFNTEPTWPPPIIEGDPMVMYKKIEDHMLAIRFYKLILEAVIAENLFRYRLLEEAKENTSALLEELQQAIQIERRREITQQLQELLAASGMLDRR